MSRRVHAERRAGPGGSRARIALGALLAVSLAGAAHAQPEPGAAYNTVKAKLAAGEQVFGGTVTSSDPAIYCAMANAGYDFLWIEMQHSPLTYDQVARMIWACRDAAAIPFIRVPDATAGDIQKATDIGALGVIVPLVDSVEEIRAAVRFAKYPPAGERSLGGGQFRALWGDDYRATANDNVMVVAMIESPAGVELVERIAAEPGVDVVFAASTDLGSFSGLRQGDAAYETMIERIRDATLAAGRVLGGPQPWRDRAGFAFFQGPSDTGLVRMGVERSLSTTATGVAPIEGTQD